MKIKLREPETKQKLAISFLDINFFFEYHMSYFAPVNIIMFAIKIRIVPTIL